MRQSQLFTKIAKCTSAEDLSANARLLNQGGFIFQEIAGVYSYLPLGLRVLHKIEQIVREEMDAIGATEMLMPSLSSKSSWEITGRIDTVDVLFKALGANIHSSTKNPTEYILNSTHEEVITPTVKSFLNSYKDFPKAVYQIQTKFRNEARAKSGILRGREFRMKDLYSFHTNSGDFENYYETVKRAYFKIFDRLSLKNITKYTYASGGDFSDKYSNEFQVVTEVGEDEINICSKCDTAYNKEIFTENFECIICGRKVFTKHKACEVGNIFTLGSKYTKAFNFNFIDKDNKQKEVLMGCYGIGTSRLMGVVVEAMHSDDAILWPDSIAPFKYHIISIGEDDLVVEKSQTLYETLMSESNGDVLWDDRSDTSAGQKLKDAQLIGVPARIIISAKSMGKGGYEFKYRNEEEKIIPLK